MPTIIEYAENPPILRCAGEEDRMTQSLRRRALTRAFAAQADLVVDLSELIFADTSLVLDLAVLSRRLRRRGRKLLLHAPQPQVWMVIEMCGLHRLPGVRFDGPAPTAATA